MQISFCGFKSRLISVTCTKEPSLELKSRRLFEVILIHCAFISKFFNGGTGRMTEWQHELRVISKRHSDLLLPRNIRLETFVTRSEGMKYCAISPCVPTEKRIQLDWWRIFKWAHFNLKSRFCSLSKSSKNKELERKLSWYFVSSS